MRTLILVLLALPAGVWAQATSINGSVTDSSGGAMASAIVRVRPNGGAAISTVTSPQGTYQFPSLPAAEYVLRVESPGFTPAERTLSLLVGQSVTVDIQLKPAQTTTTVEVLAEAVEVNVNSSQVAGNVDPRMMKDVPLNGRNWMELSLLVPGITQNAVSTTPLGGTSGGKFQINLDGQQVTQNSAGSTFGQPKYSRDALDQFQIITNRFDATLGRSSQIQVNAQTKSGTNSLHGSAYGYFRTDSFNAADPVAHTVLPFSDQQYGGTVGGRILRDKMWFFGAFEGERQPGTIFTTPIGFEGQSFTFPTQLTTRTYLGRLDYALSSNDRLSLRLNAYTWDNPFADVAGTEHPSRASAKTQTSYGGQLSWSRIVSPTLVNEVRAGYNHFDWTNEALVPSQEYRLNSTTVGGRYNYPQKFNQDVQQYRDDVYWTRGSHSIRGGAEYLYNHHTGLFQQNLRGTVLSFSKAPASLAAVFPVWNDPSTWQLGTLGPLAGSFVQGFGDFQMDIPRHTLGFWFQDDWKLTRRLTLNLGLRYDNDLGIFDPGLKLASGLVTPRSGDNNNIAPRLGFAYDLLGDRKTVIRGGAGLYYADIQANQVIDQQLFNGQRTLQVSVEAKNGSTINLASPFNGTSGDDFLSGKVPVAQQSLQLIAPGVVTPYSFQASLGFERQIGKTWTLQADYVHWRVYHEWVRLDSNLSFDPATGFPVNPNKFARPDSRFTSIQSFQTPDAGGAIYDALQMELRRRLAQSLTVGVTYTLSRLKDSTTGPFYYANNQYDLADEWANSTDDQRHTLNLNGTYNMRWGFQLGGFYHFGSGNPYQTTVSGNPFGALSTNRTFLATTRVYNNPANNSPAALASGYLITARNQFVGKPIHRVDARLSKTIAFRERMRLTGIAEAFNLLNHSNYGAYRTAIDSSSYGLPAQNLNLAYAARMLQLAARFEF